ncbi:MAG: CRISPR-associated endoribonuclease Cas6 [Aquificaceae bacterium]|jgi:CRISPR-associated endoribonuclease Cas6|uniref:CRISPR-associated endoribonuclease Cas6 n=1 Tax=Hydrogenobacter sp. Uz 6-8 TaxID=3384828 RepID=UPI00309E3C34
MEGFRLQADIKLSQSRLPLLFRNRLMSAFKSLMEDELYAERLPRPFSFFLSFEGELHGEDFVLRKPVARLYMSFLEKPLGETFAGKLLSLRDFPLSGDIKMSVSSIRSLPVKNINSPRVVFRLLSPAVLESKENKPILPSHGDFQNEFNRFHRRVFELLGYEYRDVSLRFHFWKKIVVKHTLSGFRRSSGKRLMYLTGFVGRFEVEGDPQSLRLLYLKGWGGRTGEGFGFVDVEDVRI